MSIRRHLLQLALFAGFVRLAMAASPATKPTFTLDDGEIHRGQEIRRMLLGVMEDSYQNEGRWPERLPAVSEQLVYVKPATLGESGSSQSRDFHEMQTGATVVLYELPGEHPDGAWVGYADGHLEFARTPEELRACQAQLGLIVPRIDTPDTQPGEPEQKLTLKIVDPDGKPVADASVGEYMFNRQDDTPVSLPKFVSEESSQSLTSDSQGLVTIPATTVFDAKFTNHPSAPLYVYQQSRGLIAGIELNRSDFESNAMRVVRLSPSCVAHGSLTSVELNEKGRQLSWTNAIIFKPGQMKWYTINFVSRTQGFDVALPPGDYGVDAYGTDVVGIIRYFRIEPGMTQLNFQLDLPSDSMMRLIGQPAPELRQIKGWLNSPPLTLSKLRGKVVLLEFWGYWCGPCVASMPNLMKLYDQYKDKGLVIIAVHDDSLPSIGEVATKLDEIRQEDWPGWKGRNLPFPIALDGGGDKREPFTSYTARGATTAEYGIGGFPTTIAIGRDGNVIGYVSVRSPDGMANIEGLLKK